MAKREPAWMSGLDEDQKDFYLGLDPQQAVCRGSRRHNFALDGLVPGDSLPSTLQAVRQRGGVIQITDHCQRGCGRWRRYSTFPGGAIDWDSCSYGGGGKRYLATGLGLTASDDRAYKRHIQDEAFADAWKLLARRLSTVTAAS